MQKIQNISGNISIKNGTTVNIGDLKWKDGFGNEKVAETDTEKAASLEDFFTSVYTVETDNDFEPLQSRIIRTGLDTVRCLT